MGFRWCKAGPERLIMSKIETCYSWKLKYHGALIEPASKGPYYSERYLGEQFDTKEQAIAALLKFEERDEDIDGWNPPSGWYVLIEEFRVTHDN